MESGICGFGAIDLSGRLDVACVVSESLLSFVEHLWFFIFEIDWLLRSPYKALQLPRSTEKLRSFGEDAGV